MISLKDHGLAKIVVTTRQNFLVVLISQSNQLADTVLMSWSLSGPGMGVFVFGQPVAKVTTTSSNVR